MIRQFGSFKGQSLMEVLIALGVLTISITAGFFVFFGGQSLSVDSANVGIASDYAQEGVEAVRSIANRQWTELINGNHGLVFNGNSWLFGSSSVSDSIGIFTRTISIGSSIDNNIKNATTTVTWQTDPLRTQKVELVEQLTKWNEPSKGGCRIGPLSGDWSRPITVATGNLGSGNQGTDVVVKLPYAYVSGVASSASKPDIFVFDVSTSSPSLVKSLDIGSDGINSLFLKGNYLYAASGNDSKEFMIFDISDPPNIKLVSSLDLAGDAAALSVTVFSNTAVVGRVSSSNANLYFIDISNPASPSVISSVKLDGDVNSLAAINEKLYVATSDSTKDVIIYDITNSSSPSLITSYDIVGAENSLSVGFQDPGNILVGNADGNLYILGATTTSQIYVRSRFNAGGAIEGVVCVAGNLAFLTTKNPNKEFLILNITNPDNPTEYASLNFPNFGTGIDFANNKIYMAVRSNDSLRIITSQ